MDLDCSTEEAVENVINFICNGLDQGYKEVTGIFFDHNILLQMLKLYGIRPNK